jgi:hypothetical protein
MTNCFAESAKITSSKFSAQKHSLYTEKCQEAALLHKVYQRQSFRQSPLLDFHHHIPVLHGQVQLDSPNCLSL